jgi:hypothetical protein
MNPKLITSLVENIISSIENIAVATVNAIRVNLFKVRVDNFPKTQSVKGTVTVANQKNLEKEVRNINKSIKKINNFKEEYLIQDRDEKSKNTSYIGLATHSGQWMIKKIEKQTTFRYIIGETDYLTNWNNRKKLIYKRIFEI